MSEMKYIKRYLVPALLIGNTLLFVCLMSGCATVEPLDISDYPHSVEYFEDRESYNAARESVGAEPSPTAQASWHRRDGFNYIFILSISEQWDACHLRHEQRHVIEGHWHGDQPNNTCW